MLTEPQTRTDSRLPDGARTILARLAGRHLVGSALVEPAIDALQTVFDPATGRALADAPAADASDAETAVTVARSAAEAWARVPARERGKLVAEGGRRIAAASRRCSPPRAARRSAPKAAPRP